MYGASRNSLSTLDPGNITGIVGYRQNNDKKKEEEKKGRLNMVTMNNQFGVSQTGLLASIWILTTIAPCLTIARPLVRHLLLRRLYWDDAFQFAAWLLLLSQSIAYTHYIPSNYKLSAIQAGREPKPSNAQYSALVASIFTAELVIPLFFWTCLFCAKFSFLWLYRLLLRGSGEGMKIWWAGNITVLICYGVILIGLFAECGPAQNLTNPEACTSPSSVALDYKLLPMQFAFNIFSDLLVMALRLPLLWRLKMPVRQRLAITAVSSLALVTIAMDILRLVETEKALPEVTWQYTSLETEVAVIVASLPAFSFLVSDTEGSRERRSQLKRALSLHSWNSKTRLRLASSAEATNQVGSAHTAEDPFGGAYTSSVPLATLAPPKEYNVV